MTAFQAFSATGLGLLTVAVAFLGWRSTERNNRANAAVGTANSTRADFETLAEQYRLDRAEDKAEIEELKERLKAVEGELRSEREARQAAEERAERAEERANRAEREVSRLRRRVDQLEQVMTDQRMTIPAEEEDDVRD